MAGLAPSAVGGALRADFSADGSVTVQSEAPLELRGPFVRDGSRFFYLRNMTTGIFGGDCYDVSMRLMPGASLQVASSSATKAYATLGAPAHVNVQIEALSGSHLLWGPHATILQSGASLRQSLVCRIHDEASVLLAEIVSFGRLASNERLCFTRYESELVVESAAGPVLYEERYVLKPDGDLDAILGGFGALACIYALGAGVDLGSVLAEACAGLPSCGCSALPNHAGWVVKGLTTSLTAAKSLTTTVLSVMAKGQTLPRPVSQSDRSC